MNIGESIKSILFSSSRKPEVASAIERPDEVLQRTLKFAGGTIMVGGGLQIDAQLNGVEINAPDKTVVVSALAKCDQCHITAKDVLICGDFSGEIVASGDVEIADSARCTGTIRVGGHALISPIAFEAGEIKIMKYVENVEEVKSDPVGYAPTAMQLDVNVA